MSDPTGQGFFDEITDELIDVIEEYGEGVVDVRRDQYEETVDENGVTIKSKGTEVVDPDSGARIVKDEAELKATFDSETGQMDARLRMTSTGGDTGTLLGDDVKISFHGPEVDGYVSSGPDGTGGGGHLDMGAADIRVGDDGSHVQFGVSAGMGAGMQFATGEDTDGDDHGEWGVRGEGGPISAGWRVEPGAVAAAAGEYYDAAGEAASAYWDDITADEDEPVIADGVDQRPGAGLGAPGVEAEWSSRADRDFTYDEPASGQEHESLVEAELSYDVPGDDGSGDEETAYESSVYEETAYDSPVYEETSYEGSAYEDTYQDTYEETSYESTSYGPSAAEESYDVDTYEVSDDYSEG